MSWLEPAWRNLRHAARALRRSPGFTLTTVAALSIGIGGSTLVFSIVEALLLRPLPYRNAERLVVVTPGVPFWSTYEQLRDETNAFDGLAAYTERAANLTGDGTAQRATVLRIAGDLLATLGIRPVLGRNFLPEEARPGHAAVAIITDDFWRTRYARSPAVLGRPLIVDGHPHTIVGVLGGDFRTLRELEPAREISFDVATAAVIPIQGRPVEFDHSGTDPGPRGVKVVALLRRGVSLGRARSEVERVGLANRFDQSDPRMMTLQPLGTAVRGDVSTLLAVLSAAVVMLLLVGCGNVVNLLLQRAETRRRELALHVAIGASTGQLTITVLGDTLLLSLGGGLVGMLLAWSGVRVTKALGAPVLTRLASVELNPSVLVFGLALAFGTGMLVAVAPAWRLTRTDVSRALQARPTAPRLRGRLAVPSLLVLSQVTLSAILVLSGALLAHDFVKLLDTRLGFRTRGILSAEIALDPVRYWGTGGGEYSRELLERARGLPGVSGAALVRDPPGSEIVREAEIRVEGGLPEFTGLSTISHDYFTVLSIPFLAGRPISEFEPADAERVVVNEAFARRSWGTASNAVGRRLSDYYYFERRDGEPMVVTGVVADARDQGTGATVQPRLYRIEHPHSSRKITILLRARNDNAAALAGPLAALVKSLDPDIPLYNVLTLDHIFSVKHARQRLMVTMMAVFAVLTLLLAAVGVYGVMASSVTLRTQEIGVRRAFGGSGRSILALMLKRGLWLVGAGMAIGLPVAVGVRWYLMTEFIGSGDMDAAASGFALACVAAAGLVASLVPAWRAMRLDPIAALRCD